MGTADTKPAPIRPHGAESRSQAHALPIWQSCPFRCYFLEQAPQLALDPDTLSGGLSRGVKVLQLTVSSHPTAENPI